MSCVEFLTERMLTTFFKKCQAVDAEWMETVPAALNEIHWGEGLQLHLHSSDFSTGQFQAFRAAQLASWFGTQLFPCCGGSLGIYQRALRAGVKRLVLWELTFRHRSPRWIWPYASGNHFEHQTNHLNSLGLAGQSGACIPKRKSRSFSLHLQRCAGLAALVCKLKVAWESSPLPLSTQGTWDTNRQLFNFI